MSNNFRYICVLIGYISFHSYYQAALLSHSPIIKHWNESIDATQIAQHFDDNVWFYVEVPNGRSKAAQNNTLTNVGAATASDGTTATLCGLELDNGTIRWNDTGIDCRPIIGSQDAKLFEARRMYQAYSDKDIERMTAFPREPMSHG
ncbi:hypothetical protein DdX_15388 [Ditylenchus destructor]|uniref:Uncharacterized protein n=1 Tax=Ditylenchus destructor TaxID=166010 RepID=A0AAD4QXR6_9BILA|nr:hypothetical protein DdX_15388 [Ditylenchus destructor]